MIDHSDVTRKSSNAVYAFSSIQVSKSSETKVNELMKVLPIPTYVWEFEK